MNTEMDLKLGKKLLGSHLPRFTLKVIKGILRFNLEIPEVREITGNQGHVKEKFLGFHGLQKLFSKEFHQITLRYMQYITRRRTTTTRLRPLRPRSFTPGRKG